MTQPTIRNELTTEYSKYMGVRFMTNKITTGIKGMSEWKSYEALNSLERLLISLSNNQLNEDHFKKFREELTSKKIPGITSIVNMTRNVLSNPKKFGQPPISYDCDTIKIGVYTRILPPGRLSLLLSRASLYDVSVMVMRYASLLPRGQQWNIPQALYRSMVLKHNVDLEGFASPMNSQIISVNPELNFCSLFLDTDKPFGSIGSFFEADLDGRRVMANPPYIEPLMNAMADRIVQQLKTCSKLFLVITVPSWTDARYYKVLEKQTHLKRIVNLRKNKHYYESSNPSETKAIALGSSESAPVTQVVSGFDTTMFVIVKGYPHNEYTNLRDDIYEAVSV